MKKILFTTIVLTIFSLTQLFAQKVDMKWGPEFEPKGSEMGLVGKIKGAFYTIQIVDKKLIMTKIRTSDMSTIFTKELPYNKIDRKSADDKVEYWGIVQCKKNFVLFVKDTDKKTDKEYVYGQIIDFEGNPQGGMKELMSRDMGRKSKDGSFERVVSDDSSKILIVGNPIFEKYADEKFNYWIFDQSLKLIKGFSVSFPFKDKDFSLKDYDVTNEGIIVILARIDLPKKDRKKEEETYYYQLVTINPINNVETKQYDINLDKKYIEEAELMTDKNNNIKCIGLYAEMKDNGKPKDGINGTFYMSIDKTTGKITSSSTKEFSKQLVEELSGKRRAKKDKGLESNFTIVSFIDKETGGCQVILEQQYITTTTTCSSSSSGGQTCTTNYHYHNDELLIVNVDLSGKIENYVTIPKLQVSTNDGGTFNSIYSTRYDGKTYIFYADNKKNTGQSFEYVGGGMASIPVCVAVSDNGVFTKSSIGLENTTGKKKQKFYFTIKPQQTDKISNNEAILYGYKYKKRCCCGGGKPKLRYGYMTIQK